MSKLDYFINLNISKISFCVFSMSCVVFFSHDFNKLLLGMLFNVLSSVLMIILIAGWIIVNEYHYTTTRCHNRFIPIVIEIVGTHADVWKKIASHVSLDLINNSTPGSKESISERRENSKSQFCTIRIRIFGKICFLKLALR